MLSPHQIDRLLQNCMGRGNVAVILLGGSLDVERNDPPIREVLRGIIYPPFIAKSSSSGSYSINPKSEGLRSVI